MSEEIITECIKCGQKEAIDITKQIAQAQQDLIEKIEAAAQPYEKDQGKHIFIYRKDWEKLKEED